MSTTTQPAGSSLDRPVPGEELSLLLTEEQEDLRSMVRDFCADQFTEAAVRDAMASANGFDPAVWRRMGVDLGICGLAVPEELGGAGGSFQEVLVVVEELGRSLACTPFFSSVVLSQSLLLALEPGPATGSLLRGLADGSVRAAVAFAEPGSSWTAQGIVMQAAAGPSGTWSLSGVKTFVVDGSTADVLLVVARTPGGLSVFSVDPDAPGVERVALSTMDETRKQSRLRLDEVPAVLCGHEGEAERALARMLTLAAIALAVESVGGAQRVLEMAVEYAKERKQFGRTIGSFQAIKHKCADMLIAVESAKSAASQARALSTATAGIDVDVAASLAKSFCTEAFHDCAAENIQVHGGIGFTWEHPAHLYFKRAVANKLMFGTPAHHRERMADLLAL